MKLQFAVAAMLAGFALAPAALAQSGAQNATAAIAADAENPAALAAARRLVVAARVEQTFLQYVDQLIPAMLEPMARTHGLSTTQQRRIAEIMSEEVRRDPEQLIDLIARTYARHLNSEDLDGLVAFYESPLGQRSLDAQSRMMPELQAVGAQWGEQVLAPRLLRRLEELSRNPPAPT